jgi:hypothetical protein
MAGFLGCLSPKDMKRRVIDSSEETVTEHAIQTTGLRLLAPPVVLIVVRGMILAHTFPVAVTAVPVAINQDMKALVFRPGIDVFFMVRLFEGIGTALLTAIVEEAAHGTRAIRMDQWRSVTVPLPPEREQRAITAFVDRETARIDALVAKKERLIELLQEKRIALITRAVTKGLKRGESKSLEFKSTLRWSLKDDRQDDKGVTHSVLKTIAAFLNTEGGDLLIGVADDGSVVGIEADRLESEDKFMRH